MHSMDYLRAKTVVARWRYKIVDLINICFRLSLHFSVEFEERGIV